VPAPAPVGQILKALIETVGRRDLALRSWPGWPPGWRDDAFAHSRASAEQCWRANGGSRDGRSALFVESRFSGRSCSSTRPRNAATSASNPSTSCTAG